MADNEGVLNPSQVPGYFTAIALGSSTVEASFADSASPPNTWTDSVTIGVVPDPVNTTSTTIDDSGTTLTFGVQGTPFSFGVYTSSMLAFNDCTIDGAGVTSFTSANGLVTLSLSGSPDRRPLCWTGNGTQGQTTLNFLPLAPSS